MIRRVIQDLCLVQFIHTHTLWYETCGSENKKSNGWANYYWVWLQRISNFPIIIYFAAWQIIYKIDAVEKFALLVDTLTKSVLIGVKLPTDKRAGSVYVCLSMLVTCNRDKYGRKQYHNCTMSSVRLCPLDVLHYFFYFTWLVKQVELPSPNLYRFLRKGED